MADEPRGAMDRDEERLAELGYKQELNRGWSRFANFAISFSIISVLAGCFTLYGQAWKFGGPIAISWGWPILAPAHPDRRRQHVRAHLGLPDRRRPLLVGAQARRPGLVVVHGLVQRGRADRHRRLGGLLLRVLRDLACSASGAGTSASSTSPTTLHVLAEIFWVFVLILGIHALINIYSSHLVALFSSISVFWHVVGMAVIIGILIFVPGPAPERRLRLHRADQPLRLPDEHVLVVHPARRVPPDHVHDHRLRRLGARLRGDPRGRAGGGQGRLAVGRHLGADRLVRAAGDHLRRHRRRCRQRGAAAPRSRSSPPPR